jgi:hypothetical protein
VFGKKAEEAKESTNVTWNKPKACKEEKREWHINNLEKGKEIIMFVFNASVDSVK